MSLALRHSAIIWVGTKDGPSGAYGGGLISVIIIRVCAELKMPGRSRLDEHLDRLQDGGRGMSSVVRLVHCVTGPRLRRQYFVGSDTNVRPDYGVHYLDCIQSLCFSPRFSNMHKF